jgi:hypothetical protein
MAKKRRKKSSARRAHPQRAKFKKAAKACQAQVRSAGITAFSREQWTQYGKCMKKAL